MGIYQNIIDSVGKTPIVRLRRIEERYGLKAELYAKVESFNPGSSVKDRIAKAMIEDAEKRGLITEGATIIEPTSGNTGIGLAMVGAAKGYKVVLVMPDTLSIERRKIMIAYGAELVLTDGTKGMKGAIAQAEEMIKTTKNSFMPYQFQNPANPKIHYETTGPEIWADMDGKIDAFVAGIGTGGTISGAGRYLKEQNPSIKVIAIEPEDSPVLTKGTPGPHKIQGIGAGFIPGTLDVKIYDEVETVSNQEAFAYAKVLPRAEGIFAGISSGAALCVGIRVASRPEMSKKKVLIILPDTGERYLSTNVFED